MDVRTFPMRFGVLAASGLLMLALAGFLAWQLHQRQQPAVVHKIEQPRRQPQEVKWFSLTERSGQTVTLDDLRGKIWIASFFFSNCPGICVKLNQSIAQLAKELTDDDVRFVSITVDPDNDTPERLKEYANRFGANPRQWLFLTGPANRIEQLAEKSFQVPARPGVHSERLILVDRQGRVQGSYRGGDAAELAALRRKVTQMLKVPG